MKKAKVAAGGVAALLVIAQLVPVERSNPPATAPLALPQGEVGEILAAACLDCHSHETRWPWYARVAPSKFLVARHVSQGREELNFSTWGDQPLSRQVRKLEEVVEEVESGHMPERSYTWLHPEARLADAQREALSSWARAERARLEAPGAATPADPPADPAPDEPSGS